MVALADSPTRGLPPGVGALEYSLLATTKSNPTLAADIILAYTTLTRLSPGKWAQQVAQFTPARGNMLFSMAITLTWTSRHFREKFAIPLLELQHFSGEPTFQTFTVQPGQRIQDKVYLIHSWQHGGRSKVSWSPWHNEPNPQESDEPPPMRYMNMAGEPILRRARTCGSFLPALRILLA
jgi:hypothetical protein